MFGNQIWVAQGVRNVDYSVMISGGHDLFGCVALKKKEYCILNKQYSPNEYTVLRERIMEEMNKYPYIDAKGRAYRYGEFFPPEMSPFGYNETNAQEFFPLSKNEAIEQGYQWYENTQNTYQPTIRGKDLPKSIKEVSDDITKEVIACSDTGRVFRIIPSELDFYRRMRLPLPSIHPDMRHMKRTRYRNPIKIWHRTCQCAGTHSQPTTTNKQQPDYQYQNTAIHAHGTIPCPTEFETSYAPGPPGERLL